VLFVSDAQTAGSGAVGFCDPETQTIGVVNSQANDALQDTFLHEVLHAICHVMGLRESEKEENFVRCLVAGLCTVWNHNPAVLKCWITQSLYSTAAIVVSSMCFICLQLSILHPSRWFDWLSLVNDLPLCQAGKRKAGHIMPSLWCVFSFWLNQPKVCS
jgi:hypothetical protein